jgi:hypothetical protein
MHKAKGGCHCGNIGVDVELAAAPETYRPRACDCDFCRKHGAAWVSDAKGSLHIHIRNAHEGVAYRQGSKQAELLLCRNCGVLVAVLYRTGKELHAAVNAKALASIVEFGAEQTVSPQKLSAAEKTSRWQDKWFSKVHLRTEAC